MGKFNPRGKESTVLSFKRWSSKGYALFSVLNKQVRIGVLLVAYLYVAMPAEVFAQGGVVGTDVNYELDEVEVSATRVPVALSKVARMMSVIATDKIEAAPAASIQELLGYSAGVDIRQRGPYGVQADISVRGSSFDQTIILLNGVNLTDPQTGHHNFNLPVSLKSIRHVEILQGAAARVYGPNAFGGAVNIITGSPGGNSLHADVSAGGYGLYDAYLSGTFRAGGLRNFIAFNYASSDGYMRNTDFTNHNVFYQGSLHTRPVLLDIQLGHSQKAFGANSFYTPEYPDQYEETATTFVSFKMETTGSFHLTPALYWRRHHDRFELFRYEAADWYKGHNYHLTDIFGVDLNGWFDSALGKTSLGTAFRSENIWSNVLGKEMDEPVEVPGEEGHFFTKSYSRTTISYFLEHSVTFNRLMLCGGLLANRISDRGLTWDIYPGLDASFAISQNLKATASVNRSLRMPTFTDLYYEGPKNRGNENLKPERSITMEGGLKFTNSFVHAQAVYYRSAGKNLIDWIIENAEDDVWETRNLTEVDASGIEVVAGINISDLLGREAYLNHVGLSYSFNHMEKDDADYLSYYKMDYLRHKLVVEVDHRILKNINAAWKFRYQNRNGDYELYKGTNLPALTAYEPFWLVDVKCRYRLRGFQLYVSVTNLFDESYVDIGNIKQPGRWMIGGVSVSL